MTWRMDVLRRSLTRPVHGGEPLRGVPGPNRRGEYPDPRLAAAYPDRSGDTAECSATSMVRGRARGTSRGRP